MESTDAKIFLALSDSKRLLILEYLRKQTGCATDLKEKIGISQSSLSYHMKILVASGLVVAKKEGKWKYYFLDELGSMKAKERLDKITTRSKNYSEKCC